VPDAAEISRAIVIWTGFGSALKPDRDPARLVESFGELEAVGLFAIVRRLEAEFYESDASSTVAGLAEMGRKAANDFRLRHPEISGQAVEALAWCYTFDWK
jgi:hypothetical protein